MKLLSAVERWSRGSSYLIGVSETLIEVVVDQYHDNPGFCVSSRTPPCPKNHGLSMITLSLPGSVVIEWHPSVRTANARTTICLIGRSLMVFCLYFLLKTMTCCHGSPLTVFTHSSG